MGTNVEKEHTAPIFSCEPENLLSANNNRSVQKTLFNCMGLLEVHAGRAGEERCLKVE
jgi:hypothetical protein